jgi:uncharacterized protein
MGNDGTAIGDTLSVDWVVKASKLCNLRCRYCYEWEQLADRRRLSLAEWEQLLENAANFARLKAARHPNRTIQTRFVWHGGEPLLLGAEYIDRVIALERRIFDDRSARLAPTRHLMQTNYYKVDPRTIDCLTRNQVSVGVSLDMITGARLDAAGNPTEERVLENIRRYLGLNIVRGLIVVLAGHTVHELETIYAFARQHKLALRVLPLFDGPASRPMSGLDLEPDAAIEALFSLFRRWLDDGCPITVKPLDSLLKASLLNLLGLEQPGYDRRRDLDSIFLVDTDGSLFQPGESYGSATCLGNILNQPIDEILMRIPYRESLDRNDWLVRQNCAGCDYDGACDRYPVLADRASSDGRRGCEVAQPLLGRIDAYLAEAGFGAETVDRWFGELTGGGGDSF